MSAFQHLDYQLIHTLSLNFGDERTRSVKTKRHEIKKNLIVEKISSNNPSESSEIRGVNQVFNHAEE